MSCELLALCHIIMYVICDMTSVARPYKIKPLLIKSQFLFFPFLAEVVCPGFGRS